MSLTSSVVVAQEVTVPDFTGRPRNEHPILAPCTRFDGRYTLLRFSQENLEKWPGIYHKQVSDIIDEYAEPPRPMCNARDYTQMLQAGPQLELLARSLPTWADERVPVSRFDTTRVLLEYLRIYECALTEFDAFRLLETTQDFYKIFPNLGRLALRMVTAVNEVSKRAIIIEKEIAVARKALTRTMTLLSGLDHLRPLEAELNCMQRLSLDVRNIAALSAETSSCLPRTWNASETLRDYP